MLYFTQPRMSKLCIHSNKLIFGFNVSDFTFRYICTIWTSKYLIFAIAPTCSEKSQMSHINYFNCGKPSLQKSLVISHYYLLSYCTQHNMDSRLLMLGSQHVCVHTRDIEEDSWMD